MNTHDIELPEPKYPGTKLDIPNAIPDLYATDQVIAAIEADRRRGGEQIYTYHAHLSHPGFGWIDPIMDAECPLIEMGIAEDICVRLNQRVISTHTLGEPVAYIRIIPYDDEGNFQRDLIDADKVGDLSSYKDFVTFIPLYEAPQPAEPHPPHRDCTCAECAPSFEDYPTEPGSDKALSLIGEIDLVLTDPDSKLSDGAIRTLVYLARSIDKVFAPQPAEPVRDEPVAYHPCTSILIEGLKRLQGGSAILAEWDRARSKVDAPQPAESAKTDDICQKCGGDGAGGEHEDDCSQGEPVALMREAALHLTNWLDMGECECEGPGHQCGRTQVERCRDRLLDDAPQPAEPVNKTDWSAELSSWSDEDFIQVFHERPDLANRLRKTLAEPVRVPSDEAANRVRAFLDRRAQMRGIDQAEIYALDSGEYVLRADDLRSLLANSGQSAQPAKSRAEPVTHQGYQPIQSGSLPPPPAPKATQPAEPVKVRSDDIDIEDVRQYLDSWGCLAHPGIRALFARYGQPSKES